MTAPVSISRRVVASVRAEIADHRATFADAPLEGAILAALVVLFLIPSCVAIVIMFFIVFPIQLVGVMWTTVGWGTAIVVVRWLYRWLGSA